MVKRKYDALLEPAAYKKLKDKAEGLGFFGRGWLGLFMTELSSKDFFFIPVGFKAVIESK